MSTMRLFLICLVALLLFLSGGISLAQRQQAIDLNQLEGLRGSKPYERWLWGFKQRAYPLGYIPLEAKAQAFEQTEQAKLTLQAVVGNTWLSAGPRPIAGPGTPSFPVAGRVADIAIDPGNANHWLIGGAQGGIWETFDGGASWSPRTDSQASLAMGAIAFAPSDQTIVYAGTGEAVFSGDAYAGAGLLKSTNGGTSWQLLATSTFSRLSFSDIKVHPTNSSVLVAATARGDFFGEWGIYKSTDGGANWSRNFAAIVTDLEVNPSNFNIQYAGVGEIFGPAFWHPANNGLYRSTNGGDTWSTINGPWTATQGEVGRVELALSPSNPEVLYVSIQDAITGVGNDSTLLGIWRTNNASSATPTWSLLPSNGVFTSEAQWWYNHEVSVDPVNPSVLYLGGVNLRRFDGASWTTMTGGIHVDQHTSTWAGSRLVQGNDGGVYSTTNGGASWTNHNANLALTQFYLGSLHPTDPNFAIGGSQDNGTAKWSGSNTWQAIFGGDGASSAIASGNPATHWAVSAQLLDIFRTTNGGSTFTIADSGINHTGVPFIARFEKCPNNDNVFIAGTDNIWKSANFFSSASPTWTANGPDMVGTGGGPDGITALAFAGADPSCNIYSYGTAQGQLRLTTNGGTTWTDIDAGNNVPGRFVTDLAFDPTNSNILYVTLSGFDEGTPSQPGHLFKTTNALSGSPIWSNVSPPINLPHNAIIVDPSAPTNVFAGNDLTVWKSTNGGATWAVAGSGLPSVAVFDLQINASTGRLMAFTHGRGAYMLGQTTTTNTVGLFNPLSSTFFLSNANSSAPADLTFNYGPAGAGWIPVSGDWNGDGVDTIGLFKPTTSFFFLRNSNSSAPADVTFGYGPAGAGWIPIAGDWNGDGTDTIGLYDPASSIFFLRNSNSTGVADLTFSYGPAGAGWKPVVGDWNGDGVDTIGLYNPVTSAFFLRNSNSSAPADLVFFYGPAGAGWIPITGDWNGDGTDTIGLYNPGSSFFFLRNTNSSAPADLTFSYGPAGAGWIPVVGDWDGL